MTIQDNACNWFTKNQAKDINGNFSTQCSVCSYHSWEHATHHSIDSIEVNGKSFKSGDVVRLNAMHRTGSAFCDAVILGFSPQNSVKIARPYAYASLAGTACASVMLGSETFTITLDSMMEFDTVISGNYTT
jgi:hypothetical protein